MAHHHSGQALSEDDIATALMKELQDLQDTELAQILADVLSMVSLRMFCPILLLL